MRENRERRLKRLGCANGCTAVASGGGGKYVGGVCAWVMRSLCSEEKNDGAVGECVTWVRMCCCGR